MNIKRTVSMLLVVLMLITAMPVTVFAAERLYAPTVTLASDYANGGLVFTIGERNPEGVQYYIVKVYNKNAVPGTDAPVYESNFYTTSGKIAIHTTAAPTNIVAGNEYFITVEIQANAGYAAPAAVTSETVKAVAKMYDYDIDSTSYIDLDYSEGQILDLSGLKVKVYASSADKKNGIGTVITYPDPAITVFVNNEEASGSYVLNAADHNNAKVTMSFTGSTKTVTIGTLRVRIKLATPSITAKPDFAKGGIAYTITDTNTASNVDGYFIDMGVDGFVRVTDKTGTIYYNSDLGTGNKLQSMKQYDLRVYAMAKESYGSSAKWYANSGYSDVVEDVYAVNQLKELILVSAPDAENLAYDSADENAVFKADGLSIKFKFVDNSESQVFKFKAESYDKENKDFAKDKNFEAFGVTISPAPGTAISTSLNGKQITVSAGGKTVTTEEKIAVQGALTKPTIKLEPDYANGGLKYTITCADKDLVGSYTITLKQGKTTVATITTETLTGTLPLKNKDYKTDGALTIGVEYTVTAVANPKKDDTINKKSAASDASSAKAAFKVEKIEVYGKPAKTTYLVGEKIDYKGLTLNLFYEEIVDGEEKLTSRLITFEQFAEYGVTVSPANGTAAAKSATTVTVKLGSMTDTFNISVGTKDVVEFKITKEPKKVSYSAGQKLDLTGLEVYIKYSDGAEATLEYDATEFWVRGITTDPTTSTGLKETDKEVTVKCGDRVAKFSITVTESDKAVTKIEIAKTPDKLIYAVNETLDLTGLKLTLTLKNGNKVNASYNELADYGLEVKPTTTAKLTKADTTVTVYYSDSVYAEFKIVVGESTIKSLTIKTLPTKTVYIAGEAPDYTGLVVRAYFDESKTVFVDVPYADFAKYKLHVTPDSDGVTAYELTVEDTSVLVYYGTLNQTSPEKNIFATFDITVKAKTVVAMEVYSQPTLTYQAGDMLDLSNFAIKVYYSTDKKDFDIITHEMFKSFDIICTPANGTVLSVDTHNGTKVKASVGNVFVESNALTVTGKAISSLSVKSNPTKLEYNAGEKLSLAGLKIDITYVDGTKKTDVTYDLFENYGIKSNYAHGITLSASHNNKYIQLTAKNSDGSEKKVTVPVALTVVERAITELVVLKYEDTYAAGDSFDKDSLVILAKYENGSTGYIDVANVIVDPRAGLSTTDNKVTLYYGSITKEIPVYVYQLEIYNMIKDWDGSKYTDVKKGQWFYQYMAYMSAVGAIDATNTAGTTLGPADLVTRAMFVEMLYRIEGSPNVKVTGKFVDIPADASYLKAAEWAFAAGITTGTSATAFSPNNTVTREQMVTFLYRYAQYKKCDLTASSSVKSYPDYKSITGYNDGKDSYGFVKAFEWAIAEGIITGASNAGVITLNPQGIAMRCEAAKILTVFHVKFIAE